MLNMVIIHGRVTKDAELRTTNSGKQTASFRIAVNDKNGGTCFFKCVAWEKRAETIAAYFKSGKEVLIKGRLATNDWTDNKGDKRHDVEIVVDEFDFCGKKEDSAPAHGEQNATADWSFVDNLQEDSELPF